MNTYTDTRLRAGRALGHYQLIRLLDRKRAIEVWQAQHIELHTAVALKVLQRSALQEDELLSHEIRLHNEARVLSDFHSPHIVGFHDYRLSRNFRYIVIQYAPYGSVGQYYPAGRKLSLSLICLYTWQVAYALSLLHQQELIHRDVKPGNILLLHPRHALLADFGLVLRDPALSHRRKLYAGGTTAYMAPEQYHGYPCPASDQYSLAICVYEWLTGHQPFSGELAQMMHQREHFYPVPASTFRPELSSRVDEILQTALDRDPAQRYPTVRDFARTLIEEIRNLPPSPSRRSKPQSGQHRRTRETADLERQLPATLPHLPVARSRWLTGHTAPFAILHG
jgi:serine/threonine protein kinase